MDKNKKEEHENKETVDALSNRILSFFEENYILCDDLGNFYLRAEDKHGDIITQLLNPSSVKKEIINWLLTNNFKNTRLSLINELYAYIQILSSNDIISK